MDDFGTGIDALTPQEAAALKEQIVRYVGSYAQKDAAVSDKDWMKNQLQQDIPALSDEEAERWAADGVAAISAYDADLASINEAAAKGRSKEQWFADKVSRASAGVSVVQQGQYLQSIDDALTCANEQMMQTVTTKAGTINQSPNLDGFIAEQHHAETFNARAALENSPYQAEVKVPKPGETYGKNSVDVVIKDTRSGAIVHRYQVKYGADAKATIQMLRDSGSVTKYANQQIVVPPDQVAEVQRAFPGKTVVAEIGGTDKVPVRSAPLTKEQAKAQQEKVQKTGSFDAIDWTAFSTREAALAIGKNAGLLGLQAGAVAGGFALARQVASGEGADTDKAVKAALETGADAGIKLAVTGAVKASAERGKLLGRVIPKGTSSRAIGQMVCVAVEGAKILADAGKGKLTASQAMDRMGRTSVAMVYGLGWGTAGSEVGQLVGLAALSGIPLVGPFLGRGLGGLIGGLVGNMAGSTYGSAMYDGLKKVGGAVSAAAGTAWSALRSAKERIRTAILS